MNTQFADVRVQHVFQSYPQVYRTALLQIRDEIYATAHAEPKVGQLLETLKWGQPSYVTAHSKSGSTIRIDRFDKTKIALFCHCQTTLVSSFKALFPEFEYSKNRAVVFDPTQPLPLVELSMCIKMALTYHLNKK
ncbi:MAG: DUF1801 domain-containing protein [Algicola sp.]|nr:DUF1801 domain-containing protein [Algicola sp.]